MERHQRRQRRLRQASMTAPGLVKFTLEEPVMRMQRFAAQAKLEEVLKEDLKPPSTQACVREAQRVAPRALTSPASDEEER